MSLVNTLHSSLLRAAKRRHPITTRGFISAVNTHEAFLQSLPSHPGVTTLSLNRPHAKNAISLQLLKVPCMPFFIIIYLSPKNILTHATRQTTHIAIYRLPGHRALQQLRPRARPELFHTGRVLLRRRSRRTAQHVQGPGLQVPHRPARRVRQAREPAHAHHRGHGRARAGRRAGARSCVRPARSRYVWPLCRDFRPRGIGILTLSP